MQGACQNRSNLAERAASDRGAGRYGEDEVFVSLLPTDQPVRSAILNRRAAVDLEREVPRATINYADVTPLPETRDEIEAIAFNQPALAMAATGREQQDPIAALLTL